MDNLKGLLAVPVIQKVILVLLNTAIVMLNNKYALGLDTKDLAAITTAFCTAILGIAIAQPRGAALVTTATGGAGVTVTGSTFPPPAPPAASLLWFAGLALFLSASGCAVPHEKDDSTIEAIRTTLENRRKHYHWWRSALAHSPTATATDLSGLDFIERAEEDRLQGMLFHEEQKR